tara:strand:+ start:407 stop:2620 length:2214 start_codon:yes stop_codon:yes gene_type:complete
MISSSEIYEDIPTWNNGTWSTTSFKSREKFATFIKKLFKEPGQYEFDKISLEFNSQATLFTTIGVYCTSPFKSKDFIKYWDDQKNKCRKGVIFKSKKQTWYITRDYYMWLNFLPIFNKEIQQFGFADIRDAQYHMALYEMLAELNFKHVAILKKRQIASSYYHMAKLINQQWFEPGVTLKVGASLKDYINEKGSWKFLDEYAAFLNEHTAWYRPMNPSKVMMWQQKIEVRRNNRKTEVGLKGTIQGMSFEKDPTNGVGGPVKYFFHEEAGIAPKMDKTYEYMRPAMRSGLTTTGLFIAAGSVGDLSQCNPLKDMILNPTSKDIYAVETDLIDHKGTLGMSGLFIPEQWSMPPYIDNYGNSLVEEAIEALQDQFDEWKEDLTPEDYQLRISQHPRNIKEAFDHRSVSVFPTHLLAKQEERITNKDYGYEHLELYEDAEGKLQSKISNKQPIKDFPVNKKTEDKRGCLVVWERPIADPAFGTYYASIDPVSEGKTTTSDSLCSIYVMKNSVEVTKVTGIETETYIEQAKIVAAWCGRFDDINKTHERLVHIIRWYNAWTVIENNISIFINYMIHKKLQRYLVPKSQIMFLKDLGANANVFQEYGWKNTGTLFKAHLLSYAIEFTKEEIDVETKEDGTVVKKTYGIERIPDLMLIKEMREYAIGVNVDRLVSFAALVGFMRIQESNRGFQKRTIKDDAAKNLEKSKNLYKLKSSPFRHLGSKRRKVKSNSIRRSPFKNIK